MSGLFHDGAFRRAIHGSLGSHAGTQAASPQGRGVIAGPLCDTLDDDTHRVLIQRLVPYLSVPRNLSKKRSGFDPDCGDPRPQGPHRAVSFARVPYEKCREFVFARVQVIASNLMNNKKMVKEVARKYIGTLALSP